MRRMRNSNRINLFHPDAVVWGHTLEHALGGSSEFTSLNYHGARANSVEISAIKYFGRRLVIDGGFESVHLMIGDFSRDEVADLMENEDNPNPEVDSSIPYAVYRIIVAKKGDKWFVYAFMLGNFGLEVDPQLDCRNLREDVTLEEHFRRISRYLVNPDVIMDRIGHPLMPVAEMRSLGALNSLIPGVYFTSSERDFSFKDPNPKHL